MTIESIFVGMGLLFLEHMGRSRLEEVGDEWMGVDWQEVNKRCDEKSMLRDEKMGQQQPL
jgi:hypothetical protein